MTWRTGFSLAGCVLLLVTGQILIKHGLTVMGGFTLTLSGLGRELVKLAASGPVWGGLLLTGLSSFLWFDIVSRVEIGLAYPLLSTSYVLMLFASWVFFREPPSVIRWVGVLVICLGVFLISRS